MAANKSRQSTKATIKLKAGMVEGKQKYVNSTISNLKETATADNIYAVLEKIASVKRLSKSDADPYTITEKNLLQNL